MQKSLYNYFNENHDVQKQVEAVKFERATINIIKITFYFALKQSNISENMGVILKNVMKSGMTFNFCEIRQDIKTDLTEWIVELLKKYFLFFFLASTPFVTN